MELNLPFPNVNFPKHLIPNQVKQIIFNLGHDIECNENHFLNKTQLTKEICRKTGLQFQTVDRVLYYGPENVDVDNNNIVKCRYGQKPKSKFKKMDSFIRDSIPRKIYRGYELKKRYTLDTLLKELNDDYEHEGGFPYKKTSFCQILHLLKFKYKKIKEIKNQMNRPDLLKWRYDFLKKLRKYRNEKKFICWLDETWYDTHDNDARGWTDDTDKCTFKLPNTRGKRLIILSAGSENGWVPECLLIAAKEMNISHADYHEDMNGELFEKWFETQLLPNLPPNSIICMDNAPYHSRLEFQIPRKGTKKEKIIEFMNFMGIEIPQPIPKNADLLKIIKAKDIEKKYKIDELAKSHGHTVLRIPPYHCIFNPIEIIWGIIKTELRKRNIINPTNSNGVIELIKNVISNNITPTVWKNCCNHTKKIEDKYYGHENPVQIEKILINVDSESDSDNSDSEICQNRDQNTNLQQSTHIDKPQEQEVLENSSNTGQHLSNSVNENKENQDIQMTSATNFPSTQKKENSERSRRSLAFKTSNVVNISY